ncbi:hypothetical protein CYMTET_24384, partial [Cymbomonas tetramitiformis]
MEAVKLFAAFFFLASLIPATSAATDEYIREAVTRAFSSFPSRSPEEEVHPSDLRAFLSHLRDQENQHVLSTSHAQTVHVNRMLHTIQAEHVLAEKEMFSLESLQAALLSQTDAFGRHLEAPFVSGESACAGLPESVLRRQGSCEVQEPTPWSLRSALRAHAHAGE